MPDRVYREESLIITVGGYRALLQLFRHVATGDQQDLFLIQSRDAADDANEIERADPGFHGTQHHGGSGELFERGNQGNQSGVPEHHGENFRKKGI